ncbi:hypothetical protein GCM10023321_57420 [Pseudonocardia eucalypti]|uniref:VWFA domain-containing protein n=1 Tax=Pseudonocardia eucalypti TaxID=648755 RepID=A0ABP9QS50_9PSEU|nr:hypothetical protein [Pseudonocardia eucalypti]
MAEQDAARWRLLAAAVAGRPVAVTPTDSALAYSDGRGIHVPADCSAHTVIVQAALIAAGSLAPTGVRLLAGRRGSADRFLALEARRAVTVLAGALPTTLLDRAAGLHPGPVSRSVEESLRRARSMRVPGAPPWCGALRPLRLRRPVLGAEVTDRDLRDATSAGMGLDELDGDDDGADRSRVLELMATPLSNSLATKLARMLGMGTTTGASDQGGQEFSVSGSRAGTGGGGRRRAPGAPADLAVRSRPGPAAGRRYDEWCHRGGTYRRAWCAVSELLPDTSGLPYTPAAPPDLPLRAQLARLGLSDARHRRQPDGDALDATLLAELAVDRRLGRTGDVRVYENRRRTRRDLGVLVLLDASGSTGTLSGPAPVFEAQRELAGRLTAALDGLDDRVATYAFYSLGREHVRFLRVKGFDQRYDRAAQRRLAALTPAGYTRLGAAVRHATHTLLTHAGTTNTLLVVLGDGLPYDEGYEHAHAQHDTRHALTEAVERGVGCLCLSPRATSRPEVLDTVWGHVTHHAVKDPRDLTTHVRTLFSAALAEAAASRRAGTRRGSAA